MSRKHEYLWETKSGDYIWVDEMTDSHLLNAYRMVLRMKVAAQAEDSAIWSMSFQGEMAQDAQDIAINRSSERLGQIYGWEEVFAEEIKYRNLKV